MIKKNRFILTVIGILLISLSLSASDYLNVKMRFFQGARKGQIKPPEFVTSSFLQPTISATIPSKFLLSEEKSKIKKVFNLEDVALITETDIHFVLEKNKWRDKINKHDFRLDGKQFAFVLSPQKTEVIDVEAEPAESQTVQFQLQVFEYTEDKEQEMLDTKFLLPVKKIAVFGFEDSEGNPYFLSFHITRYQASPPPPPPPPPPKSIKEFHTKKDIDEFTKGAVEVKGKIKPPKLIKQVSPEYPQEAKKAKVEGIVILEARTDIYGRVKEVKVLEGKDPLLKEAAKEAVMQWVYEPMVVDGEPKEVVFTTTVTFELEEEEKKAEAGGVAGGAIRAGGDIKKPKLIKRVPPLYPEELRKEGIQGMVLLEVTTDQYGIPVNIEVLKSDSSLLNKPAIDAVQEWRYEPFVVDGKPRPVIFTVTVTFQLR